MASNFKKKQKRHLIAAIICCVLVLAIIVTTVVVCLVHRNSVCNEFKDKDFASAIAEAFGLSSRYDLKQEDLDKVEGLVYFCNVGNDTSNNYATYAYPVVMLCYKEYTDLLIKQSEPGYEMSEEEKKADHTGEYNAVAYAITDPADLAFFPNLRVLRAFDTAELSEISNSCYYTQLYAMYGMGTAVSFDTVIDSCALSKLTSLEQIKTLDKLEQLSLCYTGITDLKGLENFPKLTKLDLSYTELKSVEGLSQASDLTYLALNTVNMSENIVPEKKEESEEPEESSAEETSEEPEESEEPAESSEEEVSEEPETSEEASEEPETSGETTEEPETSEETSEEPSEEPEPDEEEPEDRTKEDEEEEEADFNDGGLTAADLAEIAKLTKLTFLDLTNNNIEDTSALSALANLQYFSISYNPVTSLKGLDAAKGLKSIYATNCKLNDASALKAITTIEKADISSNELTNLDFLAASKGVTTLNATGNKLEQASAVAGMTKLETLDLSDNLLKAAPDLSGMTVMTSLNLSDNLITDASGLAKFDPKGFEDEDAENPTTITIDLCQNNIIDLTLKASRAGSIDLGENARLKNLDLTGCENVTTLTVTNATMLKDIKGIGTLKALTTLDAEKCGLAELGSVKGLEKLTTVTITGSKMTSLDFLKDNKSITTLTAEDCLKLTDITALHTAEKLETVNLQKCTGLTDESVAAAFGTVKDDKAELIFDENSKLTLKLTGCSGITNFDIFDEYGSMTVTHDDAE